MHRSFIRTDNNKQRESSRRRTVKEKKLAIYVTMSPGCNFINWEDWKRRKSQQIKHVLHQKFIRFLLYRVLYRRWVNSDLTRKSWWRKSLLSTSELRDNLIHSSLVDVVFPRLTATVDSIKVITKSLNTFWHELIISFTDFDYFSARLHCITDFLISFVMINYNVFDMLSYASTCFFTNDDVFCLS